MWHKASARAPRWAVVVALVLLLATTALATAQSPDLLLPLVTGGGQTEQVEPEMPVDEGIPPLVEEELDPNAPVGDSQDTHSGDFDQAPADIAAVDAFNATQWTVQNNLGVGTQTPTADIDLSRNVDNYTRIWVRNPHGGDSAQTQLYLNTGTSSGVVLQQFGPGYAATWGPLSLASMARLRTTPTSKGLILTTGGNYPLILGTADTERLRITPSGQIGMGIQSPASAYRLSVQGGICLLGNCTQIRNGIKINSTLDYGLHIAPPTLGTGVYVEDPVKNGIEVYSPGKDGVNVSAPGGDGVHISNAGNDGVFVDHAGADGVYVKQPSHDGVHISNAGNDGVFVDHAGADGVYVDHPGDAGVYVMEPFFTGVYVDHPGYEGVIVAQPGENGVVVFQPGVDGVYVGNPGGHGLNVSCPCGDATYPNTGVLVWNGNIRVHNGSFIDSGTTFSVPDYVFEPEYSLMSLDELRAYVTAEKHLPNVPNEEEIRAGGLDLSDFQMKLLEKTEELTLYTLAQDDQIQSLQQENQSLGEQVETLQQENQAMQQMIADMEKRLAALEAQE